MKVALWAITSTAFFGFFQLGELLLISASAFNPSIHLCWGEVAMNNHEFPSVVQIHSKVSKCDQFGKGVDVIVAGTSGKTCPVSALVNCLTHEVGLSRRVLHELYWRDCDQTLVCRADSNCSGQFGSPARPICSSQLQNRSRNDDSSSRT